MLLTLADIQRAWELKDPAFIDYLVALAEQPNPTIDPPLPPEIETFEKFIQHIWSSQFRVQDYPVQWSYRVEHAERLATPPAPYVLPERLKLHQIITVLWRDPSPYARICLIDVIRRVPFVYGPWKALKAIYKEAEAKNDYEIIAEIAVRLDSERASQQSTLMMSQATRNYMVLRGWRYLRKLGQQLPVLYSEVAIHYLAAYTETTYWQKAWIFNHIAFHNKPHSYGRTNFSYLAGNLSLTQFRAFNDLWKRSPEPLLRLAVLAKAEKVIQFAAEGLKADFAAQLRDIDPTIIIQLGSKSLPSAALDNLIVFLLKNASKLEQQQFKALGLHNVVVRLLESSDSSAQQYAVQYVKAYARDLAVEYLLKLAKNAYLDKTVRELALQLLIERDPRRDVGLEAWGQLLESEQHYKIASEILRKHFSRAELTPEWFKARILSHSSEGFNFAKSYLFELHPLKNLGTSFFIELLNELDDDYYQREVAQFALANLKKLDLSTLSSHFVQTYLLHPLTADTIQSWIQNEDIKASTLPIDFYQALVYEPDWNAHPFIHTLKAQGKDWTKALMFNPSLATLVMSWLSDVRRFKPSTLGFEWLMKLVSSEFAEPHLFAIERLSKAFTPSDFAPSTSTPTTSMTSTPTSIDLKGQTFLFTGKMQSMTREAAEDMVTKANGKNSGSVTAKLDYLVIGDDGSPLYGNGRKGSKQVKAESLIASGATLKIISETAFLKLLAGQAEAVSADAVIAGSEYLWQLALSETETPLRQFALEYLRRHHSQLALKATDRPVDPGAELPAEFLTFDRVLSLLQHSHAVVRQLGLDIAEWELARWQPNDKQLLQMAESRYIEVRELLKKALLDAPLPANKTYHLATATLPENFVYGLCESRHAPSRELGLAILQRERRLQSPQALYQLTESPDREVRNRVIRILWTLYRTPITTPAWRPAPEVEHLLSKGKKANTAIKASTSNEPALPQRPEQLPTDYAGLQLLLRRWLYELPPGRLGREQVQSGVKPLAASMAKKALIETLRDLAVEDAAFAEVVLPLFQHFTQSRGKMERDACLVAATRIEYAHPTVAGAVV